ncbi:MAG: 30S ribosomal protein S12 methylthiotransferase RimO [Spirochaetales bacterium]|nr:30S ribosomal protein S12 methylthiotransferase RimO [Spirochaetales bacterium]
MLIKQNKFYIESLGCAKNQVDSEIMIASLCDQGFVYSETPEDADIILINTCGFIEPAKEESIVTSLDLRSRFPDKKIIMAGCLIERYKDELAEDMPEIDGFLGNKNPEETGTGVMQIIHQSTNAQDTVVNHQSTDVNHQGTDAQNAALMPLEPGKAGRVLKRTRFLSYPGTAFVKIAEGCNNRCTYCTIPLIRGNLESRGIREIIDEVTHFLSLGIKEIILVAQDTGSYSLDKPGGDDIISLVSGLLNLDVSYWLRLLYIHPDRFPKELLGFAQKDPRFLPYFDLPFQHASPRILSLMGRKGDPETYLDLIRNIRTTLPGAIIRSTFLTGFPGETEEDFRILTGFQQKAEIDWLGVFTYSREEDTPAYSYPKRVAKSLALKRKKIIEQHQIPITSARLSRFVGKEVDVLVEEAVENEELYIGRGYMNAPDVDGLVVLKGVGLIPGTIVRARIIRINNVDIEAMVVT